MGSFSKPKPPPPGAKEKVQLPNGRRYGKRTSACKHRCGGGTCRCDSIAANDREAAKRNNRPIPCGQRFRSGGTCHYTVAPGQRCPRDHSKY